MHLLETQMSNECLVMTEHACLLALQTNWHRCMIVPLGVPNSSHTFSKQVRILVTRPLQ